MLVLSSDHEIADNKTFQEVIKKAINYAELKNLVTFGIVPSAPESGYGYIRAEKPFEKNIISGNKIMGFTEKPDRETARKLIKDKRYTWNSGMFIFKAQEIINELNTFHPEITIFVNLH